MPRFITSEALRMLKEFETGKDPDTGKLLPKGEPALKAYKCPGGKWTIGWGHTGPEVYEGRKITRDEAEILLSHDVLRFERDVDSLVNVHISNNQFSALVLLAFNIGPDIDDDETAEGLGDSTLLKMLNKGDYQGAAEQFLAWCYSDGKKLAGLKIRREAEKALFLKEDYT